MRNMRQVYIALHLVDAQIAKDYLQGAGISAVIKGEYLGSGAGELPVDSYPTVWIVDDDEFEKARELISNYESDRPGDQIYESHWQCPGCGEWIEPQFTECWSCGNQRL